MKDRTWQAITAAFSGCWVVAFAVSILISCATSIGVLWLLFELIQYLQRLG